MCLTLLGACQLVLRVHTASVQYCRDGLITQATCYINIAILGEISDERNVVYAIASCITEVGTFLKAVQSRV
jgi:hypothetical protein